MLFGLLLCVGQAQAKPALQIAAAADLAQCIDELNAGFSVAHGDVAVTASIGSSGNFYAQITNGAPFDVFLSADLAYPVALAKAGHADLSSLITYAHGQLVLWTADMALDPAAGFKLFDDARVKRIAIANPDFAPYGRAARDALQHAGVWEAIQPRLVFGDNVAQTGQFIATGNAQVGLISAAHFKPGVARPGRSWTVPQSWYPLIEQGAIVTDRGRSNPLARQYVDFLRSESGRAILLKYGFVLPGLRR
ncbi:molybdate ABC transporter substrate-binding protein [Actimicrobium sp. CCC2.4]|uniref:molybdate ABC transporter substrate-binding protein n=1 Tax=Actimicrobium sp. CCC2.4 TaxID=3048606 RepID=UPI002AC971EE|nr:molybdate ABC transporter substrate-binding protein [Actimicrobium sp. CCC2.4]MEB0133939.1 molybdate ABC transporter substrate-binding protein [Actimicrobium sp. CCC2.4]WPX31479.1 molybdate ABC transporter substrate-binding protein [Actimicrobium sp. CCC2.4]